jgi:hypothetical protein
VSWRSSMRRALAGRGQHQAAASGARRLPRELGADARGVTQYDPVSEIAGPVDRTGSCATRHSSGWRDSNPKTHKDFPNEHAVHPRRHRQCRPAGVPAVLGIVGVVRPRAVVLSGVR